MKKSIIISILLGVFSLSFVSAAGFDEVKTYKAILKIKNYEYNSTNNSYSLSSLGSAVAIGNGYLLTNAHVIFSANDEKPSGYYEVCRTIDFRKAPVCFTSAELIAYDESVDLALLKYQEPSDIPTVPMFRENKINIGAPIIIYGYPAIGGDNISRSEGNIAGYQDPFYKIDGAVDHGNSGGGAFNRYGELLGIPSHVSSDNAVFGYMIPITTIRDFLAKKTKEYTKTSLPVPADFRSFIKDSQLGERSNDIISDTNLKTTSLKKYGLKFGGKLETVSTFLYQFSANNLKESSVVFSCVRLGSKLSLDELDQRDSNDDMKKYTQSKTTAGEGGRYTVYAYTSLVNTDGGDLVKVFDAKNSCFSAIYGVNLKKSKTLVDKAIAFLTTGITLKKTYPVTTSFDTKLFHIGTIPTGISVLETPSSGGDNRLLVGYFSPMTSTGEKLANFTQKKRDTVNNYFLGGNGYFDNSPSDENLKTSDYSLATFQKLYEKYYTDDYYKNVHFSFVDTKNHKKILIGTFDYDSGEKNEKYTKIIVSYPYTVTVNGKTEYYELSYANSVPATNTAAINALKEFFTNIEPIGTTPF